MDLVLVRHGEPVDAVGRCLGIADVPLSASGAAAIRALADASLVRWTAASANIPTRLVASDLSRAVESARVLGAALTLDAALDPRLRELDFGEWNGQPWNAIHSGDGARFRTWAERWTELAPPGGETLRELTARSRAWINDCYMPHAHAPGRLIVVSHAGWIRAAAAELLGRPLQRMFELSVDYARAIVLRPGADGSVALAAVNEATIP